MSFMELGSNGVTKQQFADVLLTNPNETLNKHRDLLESLRKQSGGIFELADRIYIKRGTRLKPDLQRKAGCVFNMTIEEVDFGKPDTISRINAWVQQATHNHINSIVQPNDFNVRTTMAVLDSVYYRGSWSHGFNLKFTKSKQFFKDSGKIQKCKMMFQEATFPYKMDADLKAQIIELQFANSTQSLFIILPNNRHGFKAMEEKLANFSWATIANGMTPTVVSLILPKFQIASVFDMRRVLMKMGLMAPFTNHADFSNLFENADVCIDKIVQNCNFQINEKGAEGSAATKVINMRKSIQFVDRVDFHADHPFIFVLVNKPSNAIVFQGRFSDCN